MGILATTDRGFPSTAQSHLQGSRGYELSFMEVSRAEFSSSSPFYSCFYLFPTRGIHSSTGRHTYLSIYPSIYISIYLLEYEVIWGHIDILVVAVRRLSRRWKVNTLLAGPSPTSPMRRRLPTPLFPTLPFGNRSLQTPLFWKLSSSPDSYTKQYYTKLIRLPEACPRVPDGYTFIYRFVPARGHPRLAILFYTVCPRPRLSHGWLCFFYTVCPRPRSPRSSRMTSFLRRFCLVSGILASFLTCF